MLDLAAAGECELQCIPQGTLALLIDALGRGEDSLLSDTGVGTFVDPRVGTGSRVGGTGEPLIAVEGDRLRYRIPPIDVAIFNAPAADRHGNIYVKHCAMIGETAEIARAAKRNGGRVIANVGLLVDEGYDRVFLPAEMVDAVVYHPDTEQAAGIPIARYWPALTTESDVPIGDALEQARFVNWLAGLTPRRTAVDDAVARLAASTLVAHVGRGRVREHRHGPSRAGVRGALRRRPARGSSRSWSRAARSAACRRRVSTSARPSRRGEIISSAEMFKLCYERLDATCLGVLEADGEGNVNVSRRSDGLARLRRPGRLHRSHHRRPDDRLRVGLDGARRDRRRGRDGPRRAPRRAQVRGARPRDHVQRPARPRRRQARVLRHSRRPLPAHGARHGARERHAGDRRAAGHPRGRADARGPAREGDIPVVPPTVVSG